MKKGVIFSTDGALAIAVTLIMIGASVFYIQDANRSRWDDINLVRAAYDIGLSLDREGVWSSNNDSLIKERLNRTMPANMAASAEIERYCLENGTLRLLSSRKIGEDIEGNRATAQTVSMDGKGGYYRTLLRMGLRR